MVESTALEMRRARKGTGGSNPSLSANAPVKPLKKTGFSDLAISLTLPKTLT